MSYEFTNLPKSAIENIKAAGREMEEKKKRVMTELGISSERNITISQCWDNSVKVWEDGMCIANFRLGGLK